MEYTAVIRTLGKAGEKYQQTLNSLCSQTIQPKDIIVYIADGYDIPKETCGREKYIYVKKGMVAQRALPYDEVKTEYILFLDDDVYLPENGVELLFSNMLSHGADVISPNTFDNHKRKGKIRLINILLGKAIPFKSEDWAYKVLLSGGYAYNINPSKDFYWSNTNAGPCFLCRKADFLKIHFEEELWLDETPYALPDDQVMFYKMHLSGLKVSTMFNSGIIHLDAGTAVKTSADRAEKMLYSEVKNQIVFWHRFIEPYKKGLNKIRARISLENYKFIRRLLAVKNYITGNKSDWQIIDKAIKDGERQFKS